MSADPEDTAGFGRDPQRPSMRGPLAWMARHDVGPNLIMLALIVGGLLMTTRVNQEVFPEYTTDTVVVELTYPGASPREVEQSMVLAIESATRSLSGVKAVRSEAYEGSGEVTVEVNQGADYQRVYQNVQQAVDRITTFPDDADDPVVQARDWRRDVLDMQIHGDVSARTLRRSAEIARERLLQQPGITQVGLEGAREPRVFIDVSAAARRAYGLTMRDVADAVAANALDRSAGNLETKGGDLLVRVKERKVRAGAFRRVPVVTDPSGAVVRLADIATVRDGFARTDTDAEFDDEPAIGIEVFRVGDETPIGVSEATRDALPRIEAELPEALAIEIQDDNARIYGERVQLLLKNGTIGLGLVLLLLSLFLELRLAFWVAMGIVTAFVGTFLFLPVLGVSVNMVSLFAFILALGIVVDDAIVAGENIYEHRQRGLGPLEAAVQGARDIAVPISFSVLTNIVAFLPLAFVPGGFGQLWAVIPAVVVTALVISWFEALLIMPAHLGHVRAGRAWTRAGAGVHAVQRRFAVGFARFVQNVYGPALAGAMRARYLTVTAAVALLAVVVAIPASGHMGFILMPEVESSVAEARATLPAGASEATRERVRRAMVQSARTVLAENGGDRLGDGTFGMIRGTTVEVRVYLKGPDTRPISTRAFTDRWRAALGDVAGVETLRFSSQGGPGHGPSLSVSLSHPDVPVLERAAPDLAGRLETYDAIRDVDDSTSAGKPQLDLKLTDQGHALGLTAADLGARIRGRVFGLEAIKHQRGRNEVTVMVRAPADERDTLGDLQDTLVRTPEGGQVPLGGVATIEHGRAHADITRRGGRRTTTVTANVTPIEATSRVTTTLRDTLLPQLMQDYPGLDYTFEGRQESMREAINSFVYSVSLALFVVFALLAVPLRSYAQPFIVMTAIPFGVVGAILGHLIMGYALSIISIMGMIALGGVVVNGALVMITYANRRRAEGHDAFEAIHIAGVRRFRPIMLTTLTTFGGLAPMIFETSRQARFLIPMALSLGYGILIASAILLVLTPCLYLVQEDLHGLFVDRETTAP